MKTPAGRWFPALVAILTVIPAFAAPPSPSTFSIVAADPESGEVGVAVASRFFAVGAVVPFAKAGVGAVATQSFANTTYGPRGLELLERGVTAEEVVRVLTRGDDGREQRQVGVVAALERAFLDTKGKTLSERLYAAIAAGDAKGGDARGRQSMALLVARAKGGYGGFTDRAIDLRVDDDPDPIVEMGRLLGIGLVNDLWNRGWTAFTEKRFVEALAFQERAATMAEKQPAVLPEVLYDLAVIRLAAGDKDGAARALDRALALNPKLKAQAEKDPDLEKMK